MIDASYSCFREPSETGMIDDMQSTTCTVPVAIIADEVTDKDKGMLEK